MNYWTEQSILYANQRNYLDSLFRVYPISPNVRRTISENKWRNIESLYNNHDNIELVKSLLSLELFPLKDSYVSYLRRDNEAIFRNPNTVNRIAGTLYEMGLDKMYLKCTEPKETNRQIGPLFKKWLKCGDISEPVYENSDSFLRSTGNALFVASDKEMKKFAKDYLGYNHDKGLDFIARFNNKYVIGEAKFLTDFGGHQNAQFEDAISTITSPLLPNNLGVEVIKIAICDGVLYIRGNSKMHNRLYENDNYIILSSLLLREFLYSI